MAFPQLWENNLERLGRITFFFLFEYIKLISSQPVEVIHFGLGLTGPYPKPADVLSSTHLYLPVGTENSGCWVQRPSSVSFKLELKTDGAPHWCWSSAHSHGFSHHPCALAVIWPHVQNSCISLLCSVSSACHTLPLVLYRNYRLSAWGQCRGMGRVPASLIGKIWARMEIRVN